MRKIRYLIILFLSVLGIFLFSYNMVAAEITIAIPTWFAPTDKNPSIKKLYKNFSNRTGIKVNHRIIEGGMEAFLRNLFSMINEKKPPDLAIIPLRVVRFLADKGVLSDVSGYIIRERVKDFLPHLLNECRKDGGLYGVPYDTDIMLIYYNVNHLKDAKLDIDMYLKKWEWRTLLLLAKDLTVDLNGDGIIDRWGFVFPAGVFNRFVDYFYPWMLNAKVVERGPYGILNDPIRLKRTLQLYKNMVLVHRVSSPEVVDYIGVDVLNNLAKGKASMGISGSWIYQGLLKKGKFGVLPIPPYKAGMRPYTLSSGWSVVVFKKGMGDKNKRDKIISFMNELTSYRSMSWKWKGKKYLPVYKSLLRNAEISNNWPYSFFAKQLLYDAIVLDVSPSVINRVKKIMEETRLVLTGKQSVDDAVLHVYGR